MFPLLRLFFHCWNYYFELIKTELLGVYVGGAAGGAGLAAGLHAAPLAADVRDRDGHVPERVRRLGARPVLHRALHPTSRARWRSPRLLRQHQVTHIVAATIGTIVACCQQCFLQQLISSMVGNNDVFNQMVVTKLNQLLTTMLFHFHCC